MPFVTCDEMEDIMDSCWLSFFGRPGVLARRAGPRASSIHWGGWNRSADDFLRSSSGQASLLNMKFSLRSKWIFLYFGAMERSVYKASFIELNRQRMGMVSMRRGKSMISILMRKECWVNFSLLRMNRTTGIMPNLPKSPCSSRPIRRNAST